MDRGIQHCPIGWALASRRAARCFVHESLLEKALCADKSTSTVSRQGCANQFQRPVVRRPHQPHSVHHLISPRCNRSRIRPGRGGERNPLITWPSTASTVHSSLTGDMVLPPRRERKDQNLHSCERVSTSLLTRARSRASITALRHEHERITRPNADFLPPVYMLPLRAESSRTGRVSLSHPMYRIAPVPPGHAVGRGTSAITHPHMNNSTNQRPPHI